MIIVGIEAAANAAYAASEDFAIMADILDRCTEASERTDQAFNNMKNRLEDFDSSIADFQVARQLADEMIPHYFLDDAGGAGTIIGALSRMQAVVSMRLHALIFAAGQGIPLAGVVYDPKVSAFLRYIGQEQFVDLAELTGQNLCAMMDQCVAQAAHPEAQAAAVRNLQAMEQKNVEVARRLLKG